MKETVAQANRVSRPSRKRKDEQPLIRALISQAYKRGENLTELAKHLGVSYERLSQWRRSPSAMANANENVFVNAANYLGVPIILAMVMANRIELHQFVWPGAGTLKDRVTRQLEEMRQDPFFGGFVPKELSDTPLSVQLFIAFMYHQLGPHGAQMDSGPRGLCRLQQAIFGEVQLGVPPNKVPSPNSGVADIF